MRERLREAVREGLREEYRERETDGEKVVRERVRLGWEGVVRPRFGFRHGRNAANYQVSKLLGLSSFIPLKLSRLFNPSRLLMTIPKFTSLTPVLERFVWRFRFRVTITFPYN